MMSDTRSFLEGVLQNGIPYYDYYYCTHTTADAAASALIRYMLGSLEQCAKCCSCDCIVKLSNYLTFHEQDGRLLMMDWDALLQQSLEHPQALCEEEDSE